MTLCVRCWECWWFFFFSSRRRHTRLVSDWSSDVCSSDLEAVRVQYDPAQVRFEELLAVFWSCHDPGEKRRPSGEIGSQYRSIIFAHDAEQEQIGRASGRERVESAVGDGSLKENRKRARGE